MTSVQIEAIGLANPPRRFTQDETFQMAGYTSPRILETFRNCADFPANTVFAKALTKLDHN